jgi:ADP-ribose pyrophosphatase
MDKPNAHKNGWELLRTEYPYRHFMFDVRTDHLRWPDGEVRPFTYPEAGPSVFIVPVTPTGEVVLLHQFRYIVDEWLWEIPAGGSHDSEEEALVDLARRELREEIGGEADALEYVGDFHPMAGMVHKVFHLYLATGVRMEEGRAATEPGEQIEVHRVPVERALEMARNGEIRSAPSAYALLRCEERLRALAATAVSDPEQEAIRAGEAHYAALIRGDHPGWVATLTAHNREMAPRRGSSPDFWWQTGRRYVEEHGVTYAFARVDQLDEERAKLFFHRFNADGTPRGRPVPLHLRREAGAWRVETASY